MHHGKEVNFQWVLHENCNYQCPYCWNHDKPQETAKETVYFSVKEWLKIWNNIYDKYGSCKISVSGGEPSIYPSFIELVKELSRKHLLGIVTNLSFDVERFIAQQIEPKKVNLGVSFQPLFVKFEEFLRKALILKEHGFTNSVLYVTYPPQMKQMSYYKREFERRGFAFQVQPFWGRYQDRSYPEDYTEDEKEVIASFLDNPKEINYRLNRKKTKGKLCRAGEIYAVIQPNGMVNRCGFSFEGHIGNFLDKNFKLLESPMPCSSEFCPCNENTYLIEEENKEFVYHRPSSKKDVNIALVLASGWGRNSPPYTLALFCAILKRKNYQVYPFDINNVLYHMSKEKDKALWNWEESFFWQKKESVEQYALENSEMLDLLVERILDSRAKIIGFSVYSTTKLMSLELARRIKAKEPDTYIIFGGTECQRRIDGNNLIQQDCVDFLFFDEADEALGELIELLVKGGDLSSCKGMAYKKNGLVIDTGYRSPLKNLDSLPFVDFSQFDLCSYKDQDPVVLKIATSRGCPEQCVYCSTKASVEKFRTMSGERIFQEIVHQAKSFKKGINKDRVLYLFFSDLLLNANVEVFKEWTARLAEARKEGKDLKDINIKWYGQIILRNDMPGELLENVKESGCNILNYGVESGSNKVLKDMKKRINAQGMERAIRQIYEAGIPARGNFMFGFPTETEEDFEQTLQFLERNGRYMKEIYPSRTFCALESFSYLDNHKEEFGISLPHTGGENLFWESQEGNNNYLVRLKRYEEFCEQAASLSHQPLLTGVADIKRDCWLRLGEYFQFIKKFKRAFDCYKKYLSLGGVDKSVQGNIDFCENNILDNYPLKTDSPINTQRNLTHADSQRNNNLLLNQKECAERKIVLRSTPPHVYFQIDGPCNQDCIFCSRPHEYPLFNLEKYRSKLEKKIYPLFNNAISIHLTGAGELLLLPEAMEILQYFDIEFPQADKMFATNGSTIIPAVAHLLSEARSKYLLRISLHASSAKLHRQLTASDNFEKIIENIRYLSKVRKKHLNPEIYLTFLLTTINLEDLPNFINLAADLRINQVYCEYNSIYQLQQKYLSCFFKKDYTNYIFDKAEEIAEALHIKLELPWRFNQPYDVYDQLVSECNEPWEQIMINSRGNILPCCLFGDFYENLLEKDFWQIWNGVLYQAIRKSALTKTDSFCSHCLRHKPLTINDFKAHVITRGKSSAELEQLLRAT